VKKTKFCVPKNEIFGGVTQNFGAVELSNWLKRSRVTPPEDEAAVSTADVDMEGSNSAGATPIKLSQFSS
jgi:hypothetical protein